MAEACEVPAPFLTFWGLGFICRESPRTTGDGHNCGNPTFQGLPPPLVGSGFLKASMHGVFMTLSTFRDLEHRHLRSSCLQLRFPFGSKAKSLG